MRGTHTPARASELKKRHNLFIPVATCVFFSFRNNFGSTDGYGGTSGGKVSREDGDAVMGYAIHAADYGGTRSRDLLLLLPAMV